MNFLNVGIFWLLPVVLVVMILVYWWAAVRRKKLLTAILGARAGDPAHVIVNHARRHLRFFILCLVVVLLFVAMARPWWSMSIVPYDAKGRDLMVLFDVSKSMLADDIKPSRLEHAKWLVHQLSANSGGNRYGLVAFAGEAFLECPLTRDMSSFNQYLDELDTNSIPLPGTNLQRALEKAAQAFKSAEGDNRAVILITDGEELEGNSSNVINDLKAKNIPLFIVGMGDPSAPALVPLPGGGHMRDAKGELVKTTLNENLLLKLQQEIPGSLYIRSTTTNPGLEALNAKIDALVPQEFDSGTRTRPIERFQYFIIGALALLALYLGLSERPYLNGRKTAAALDLLAALALPLKAQDEPAVPDELQLKPSPKTEETTPAVSDPATLYNLGRETQLEKKDGADQLYEKSINTAGDNPLVRGRAFHNLGVLLHEKARAQLLEANTQLPQNLDNADKALSTTQQLLNQAEEMYLRSMTETKADQSTGANFAVNQQLLLHDHKIADDLKKDIKEFKEKHQQSIQQLEESIAAGQESRPDKSVKTRQTVKRLNELSQKLQQQQMLQDSGEALKEVEEALKVIASDDAKATEHLQKALEILKKKDDQDKDQNKDQQDKQDKQDQNKDQQDKQDQNKDQQDQNKDQNKDQQQQPQPQQAQPEEQKIDPQQAKTLLEQMAKDEKNLRDAIKAMRQEKAKDIKVEKDW